MDNKYTLYRGNNLDNFHSVTDTSVDLVLTDPPYGWSFMGKDWDKALPNPQTWVECFRVMKPGGSAVIMSGSRTDCLWRLCRDIEAAGFDLSQTAMVWVYRSGFPKGQDFSKAYDERVGAEREVVGQRTRNVKPFDDGNGWNANSTTGDYDYTAPATDTANELDGWFSKGKVKPALEFLIWARKPNSESTELDNMLKWGVGGVNCGACMMPFEDGGPSGVWGTSNATCKPTFNASETQHEYRSAANPAGRFPANLLCTDNALGFGSKYFDVEKWANELGYTEDGWTDAALSGLLQIPKPSKAEKNAGCEGLEQTKATVTMALVKQCANCGGKTVKSGGLACGCENPKPILVKQEEQPRGNPHPTCKPVNLMAYVINFLTKPNATILDPFAGSGTTLVAAIQSGRYPIGMELEDEYCEIIEARADHATVKENKEQGSLFDV